MDVVQTLVALVALICAPIGAQQQSEQAKSVIVRIVGGEDDQPIPGATVRWAAIEPLAIGDYPDWASLEQGFEWIRTHTETDAIVASGRDPMVWLYTGRRSFRFYHQNPAAMFYGGSGPGVPGPDRILQNLRENGAGFVLDGLLYNDVIGPELRGHLQALASRDPAQLARVFTSEDGTVVIYRVESGDP